LLSEVLIGEGLTAIAGTLFLGLLAGAVTYIAVRGVQTYLGLAFLEQRLARERERFEADQELRRKSISILPSDERSRAERQLDEDERHFGRRTDSSRMRASRLSGISASIPAATVVLIGGLFLAVRTGALLAFIVAVIFASIIGVVFFLQWLRGPWAAALMTFLTIVVIGGVAGYLKQATDHAPVFDSVLVARRNGLGAVTGFYVTRAGGNVYVAVVPEKHSQGLSRFAVLAIPDHDVDYVVIGPQYRLASGHLAPAMRTVVPTYTVPTPKHVKYLTAPQPPPKTTTSSSSSTSITQSTTSTSSTTSTTSRPVLSPGRLGADPYIQVFALDEVTPRHGYFSFPVGGGRGAERLHVEVVAPALGDHAVLMDKNVFEPSSTPQTVVVTVPGSAQQTIASGGTITANIYITAMANGKSASASYTVELRRARKGEP
jgi:hypothetical protein